MNFARSLLVSLAMLTVLGSGAAQAEEIQRHSDWSYGDFARVPVQSGGRIKPLDSFAREIMLYVTGSRFYEGWDPTELLLSWMRSPEAWENKAFIQIGNSDVKKQLGLDLQTSRFSPRQLIQESHLAQYAQELDQKAPPAKNDMRADPREKELRAVMERIGLFRSIVAGEGWPIIPAQKAGDPWRTLTATDTEGTEIRGHFRDLLFAYRDGKKAEFEGAAAALKTSVETRVPGSDAGFKRVMSAEVIYNRTHPFMVSWILFLIAGCLWLFKRGPALKVASVLTALALLVMTAGIAVRCYVAGRPPVTNMYESIIWVSFGVVLFGYLLQILQKQSLPVMVSCFLAALGLIAADAAPAMMDPGIHPLVPVLRSNYWLTVHVLTITISYAAFALAFGLSNIALWHYARGGEGMMAKTTNLNQLSYRVMQFGVVLVAAGTILGGVWADYSWGRFWGWDPKEVWALIVLLAYLIILHGRYAGWVGQFGFALWSVICFLTVLMAWYGVNFVLGVGLHSYGFSQGGRGTVFTFVLLQLIYVAICTVAYKRRMKSKAA